MEVDVTTHELKIHPEYFTPVMLKLKKVEIRLDDRNYKERDILILREWDPVKSIYTGREIVRRINYIIKNCPGLLPGYVILQIVS